MTALYKRIYKKKKEAGLTWDQLAKAAHIPVSSWMTGLAHFKPTDDEIRKMAPVLKTNYEWLKYGTGDEYALDPVEEDTTSEDAEASS